MFGLFQKDGVLIRIDHKKDYYKRKPSNLNGYRYKVGVKCTNRYNDDIFEFESGSLSFFGNGCETA